jgi:hypothetical protein
MNKLNKIVVLFALSLGLALSVGCNSSRTLDPAGINQGDVFAYQTKETIDGATAVVDAFLAWEYNNRAIAPAEVRQMAESLRTSFPGQAQTAIKLLDAYEAEPTPANRLKLANITGLLRVALREVTAVMQRNQNLN